MPKFLSEQKTIKNLNYLLMIVTVLMAIFMGSRVVQDLERIPAIRDMLTPLGIGAGFGLSIMNIIFITILTLIALYIGYLILNFVIKSAYEKDTLTHNEIMFIYLVSSIIAMVVGIFTGFAGNFRVLVTTIAYLIAVFVLANLFTKWKKGGTNKLNIHLAVYAIILLIISLPMVRGLVFPA